MELEKDNILPFCGINIEKVGNNVRTSVYVKPTDTGLLLHHQSHVDMRYKRCLLNTMLHRAYKLSSDWKAFDDQVQRLKRIFVALSYPVALFMSSVSSVLEKMLNPGSKPTTETNVTRFVIPFKDQRSADSVKRQLCQLSVKVKVPICPVFTSRKIKENFGAGEVKPDIVSRQCVVYKFQCERCDASYVGYSNRHLHKRIDEHKKGSPGLHLSEKHGLGTEDLDRFFSVLKRCKSKLECKVYEMLLIKRHKPSLNKQSDSHPSKLL